MQAEQWQELQESIDGELLTAKRDRMLYSSDASIYQKLPLAVVRPRNASDCRQIVSWAAKHKVPLIARAAGTSLAGQVVGEGLIIDVSRHLTKIIHIDTVDQFAHIEPGMILDDLNDLVGRHGLHFGPDTSTSNRCMIGGMIGNNACGEHSIVHGTTRDHCLKLDVVLADGSPVTFKPLNENALQQKRKLPTLEGRIYDTIFNIIDKNRQEILDRYPDPQLIRRNMGYALDYLAQCKPWNPEGPNFNLAPFICGSEGTLCLVTSATMNLIPKPKERVLLCSHFDSVDEACRATVTAVTHDPSAVELIDGVILEATKDNLEQKRNRFWLHGDPAAVLVIEFFADKAQDAIQKAEALRVAFEKSEMGHHHTRLQGADIAKVWALRKAGLGLLMGLPNKRKALPLIEDAAVPVDVLPEYVNKVGKILDRHSVSCVYYAHASVGLLHIRPELDLKDPGDRQIFAEIGKEVAALVKSYRGSFSGEHGDGRLRAPFLEFMLGEKVCLWLRQIKDAFDPENLFNPHKIIDPEDMFKDLRGDLARAQDNIKTHYDWSADRGLLASTEKCNGAGACRKSPGRGTLCPSYHATHEELHSTRGRSSIFRQVLESSTPREAFSNESLKNALDLCLSCKACKSECPANVDMARLKSEFQQQYHDLHGIPMRTKVFGDFFTQAQRASSFPRLSEWIVKKPWFKRLMGIHPDRDLPLNAKQNFGQWWKARSRTQGVGKKVVLFVDEFTHFLEPQIAIDAVEVMEYLDHEVVPVFNIDSARSAISKGLLDLARQRLEDTLQHLSPHLDEHSYIVGLEPSAILGFRDEIPNLMRGSNLQKEIDLLASRSLLFEEWFLQIENPVMWKDSKEIEILFHGHCHAKSLIGEEVSLQALSKIPHAKVSSTKAGCCGMAGSFGYELEHYEISMRIGDEILFPNIRRARNNTILCAHGTSCRHQIKDGTEMEAVHPVRVIRNALGI